MQDDDDLTLNEKHLVHACALALLQGTDPRLIIGALAETAQATVKAR